MARVGRLENYNIALLRSGVAFQDISRRGFKQPDNHYRYSNMMHGVGLCDEYPRIAHPEDWARKGYDGILEANSVICVESYLGEIGGREGVKLEEQVLITDNGVELLTRYPFEDALLR